MSDSNAHPARSPEEGALPVKPAHMAFAVLGHLLVGILLISGVRCSPKPPEEIVIQAVLLEEPVVGEKPVTVEKAEKPKPPEPKPPPPKPEPPKPVEQPKPKPPEPTPEPPKPDPEKVKQQAEAAEKKRVEDVAKKQQDELMAKAKAEEQRQVAEAKAKSDAEAKAKAEADAAARKSAEEEARKVALEAEQKRLNEIEDAKRKEAEAAENKRKAEDKARQQALAAQIAADEAVRMAAIRATAQQAWVRALADAIRRNWLRPPGAENFSCKLNVKLLPNGQVVSARVLTSCGSPILDDSVIKAVYKASPLPLPTEPSAFVPDLNLTFKP